MNAVGLPLGMRLVCDNEHDSKCALDTLGGLIQGSLVLADKAYDTNAIRKHIDDAGGIAVIPPQANRVDVIEYDKEIVKTRHRVENFFCRAKRFRRINTRYDKLPETYIGFVKLCALTEWIDFDFVHAA